MIRLLILCGLAAVSLAGCDAAPPPAGQAAACPAVPATPITGLQAPKPPVSGTPLLFQPGHWEWLGGSFAYTPPSYIDRGDRNGLWQPGYFDTRTGGCVWVPGHWAQ